MNQELLKRTLKNRRIELRLTIASAILLAVGTLPVAGIGITGTPFARLSRKDGELKIRIKRERYK